jgi:endonuclease YncB( thermonuclease family)
VTAWTVLNVSRVIDGDTVVLTRSREVGEADGLRITATDINPARMRLVHVDTPERGEVGWFDAKADLEKWVAANESAGLVLYTAGRDNFGRLLGDLKTIGGDSASLYMIRDRGWLTWRETR